MANNPNNIGEIIKKHIDKLDYMGFLRMGAPNDEYDVESQMIFERMNISPTEKDIAKTISNVFSSMFGQEFDPVDFSATAREIYLELKMENLI